MNRELLFLKLLDLMTSPLNSGDSYPWHIESIKLYESGPMAMFRMPWRSSDPKHEASACMSLRWSPTGGFALYAETCTMGRETTNGMHALENRLQRAKTTLKREL